MFLLPVFEHSVHTARALANVLKVLVLSERFVADTLDYFTQGVLEHPALPASGVSRVS